jgi:hypothetical protein
MHALHGYHRGMDETRWTHGLPTRPAGSFSTRPGANRALPLLSRQVRAIATDGVEEPGALPVGWVAREPWLGVDRYLVDAGSPRNRTEEADAAIEAELALVMDELEGLEVHVIDDSLVEVLPATYRGTIIEAIVEEVTERCMSLGIIDAAEVDRELVRAIERHRRASILMLDALSRYRLNGEPQPSWLPYVTARLYSDVRAELAQEAA